MGAIQFWDPYLCISSISRPVDLTKGCKQENLRRRSPLSVYMIIKIYFVQYNATAKIGEGIPVQIYLLWDLFCAKRLVQYLLLVIYILSNMRQYGLNNYKKPACFYEKRDESSQVIQCE